MIKYVVFDGMDGAETAGQMALLEERIGSSAVFTQELSGTPFSKAESTALNSFLLFWAAQEAHQQSVVRPALQAGKSVFSNRGDSTTYAHQIYGENQHGLLGLFNNLRDRVFRIQGGRPPDLYIIFDLSPKVARDRAEQDASRTSGLNMRDIRYYELVRNGFHQFGFCHPVVLIDAAKPKEEIHHLVMGLLYKRGFLPKPACALG
ncbi:hypothetical protein HKL94_01465 [Candidatus Parcubacteria bacterium]|nr:hypothetical protein [Candidatus Parcubacteria bacterium]